MAAGSRPRLPGGGRATWHRVDLDVVEFHQLAPQVAGRAVDLLGVGVGTPPGCRVRWYVRHGIPSRRRHPVLPCVQHTDRTTCREEPGPALRSRGGDRSHALAAIT
jgi:hypothetical protein